ncbi:Hypothetical protein A7982_01112 [Minicystis rosea]|nr:Hypothetical protein A7982_01112 [Minicystis rosea]
MIESMDVRQPPEPDETTTTRRADDDAVKEHVFDPRAA